MGETTYTVPAIHCGHCADTIREEVGEVAGVESVEVDVGSKVVSVRGAFEDASVRGALRDAGYEAA
jgi:copper chaperone CopZ